MSLCRRVPTLFSLSAFLLLTGCGVTDFDTSSENPVMHGTVFGGQQPVVGSTIQVWVVGKGTTAAAYGAGATVLGTPVTSTAGGSFSYGAYTCTNASDPVYITATGGTPGGFTANANLMLMASLGPCSSAASQTVNITEVTTAASAFAMSHFFTTTLGASSTNAFGGEASVGYNDGLLNANAYTARLLAPVNLGVAATTKTAGSLTTTFESAKLNSIANSLAACVNSNGQTGTTDNTTACGQLFTATTVGAQRPSNTLQAAVQMALYPYQNVSTIYGLASGTPPFAGLSATPNDWTLAVAYTSSSFGLGLIGVAGSSRTSTTIDIDASGNVWFPTNTAASHGIGAFFPTSGALFGPFANPLVHPQYVAITSQANSVVWASDYGGNSLYSTSAGVPTTAGTAHAVGGVSGPLIMNANGALDDVNFSMGANVDYLLNGTGTPGTSEIFSQTPSALVLFNPSGPQVDAGVSGSGTACQYQTYSSGYFTLSQTAVSPCFIGGMAMVAGAEDALLTATSSNQLCDSVSSTTGAGACFTAPVVLSSPTGIAVDGGGNVWVANYANSSVSTFHSSSSHSAGGTYTATSPVAYLHNVGGVNTLPAPYGLAIDRSGNVWISNAGCVTTSCTPGSFTLSELIGAAYPTITPLSAALNVGQEGTLPSAHPSQAAPQSHRPSVLPTN